jgi:hypothetical protein
VTNILHLILHDFVHKWACLSLDHTGRQNAVSGLVAVLVSLLPFPQRFLNDGLWTGA